MASKWLDDGQLMSSLFLVTGEPRASQCPMPNALIRKWISNCVSIAGQLRAIGEPTSVQWLGNG